MLTHSCIKPKLILFPLLLALCIFCSGCESEPANVHDMLIYARDNFKRKPEKTLEYYQKFSGEGEEALIRTYFDLKADQQPFFDEEVKKLATATPAMLMLEDLSKNQEFPRRVISLSNQYAADNTGWRKEYAWLAKYAPEHLAEWLRSLNPEDRRCPALWAAYFKEQPDNALQLVLKVLEEGLKATPNDEKLINMLESVVTSNAKHTQSSGLTPAQYHLIFTNKLDKSVFNRWQLGKKDWLEHCPEDLKTAIWRDDQMLAPESLANAHDFLRLTGPLFEMKPSRKKVTPSASGNKIMIMYSGRKVRTTPHMGGLLANSGIPLEMMRLLPPETTPDNPDSYDKLIVVEPRGEATVKYTGGVDGYQWTVRVSVVDPQSKAEISSKEFKGSNPPSGALVNKGLKYLNGPFPVEEVARYIKSIGEN
ncbi:hypothetical protein LJC48_00720 [Desulfovibrio sp. OttesenSCG-928-C06]|nr:hypothetical protein [Desulfovibrio sp. OttesenSCG-928-C06]